MVSPQVSEVFTVIAQVDAGCPGGDGLPCPDIERFAPHELGEAGINQLRGGPIHYAVRGGWQFAKAARSS